MDDKDKELSDMINIGRVHMISEDDDCYRVMYDGEQHTIQKSDETHFLAPPVVGGGGSGCSAELRLEPKLEQRLVLETGIFQDDSAPDEFKEVMMFHELREMEYKKAGFDDAHDRAVNDELLYVIKHFEPGMRKEYLRFAGNVRQEAIKKKSSREEYLRMVAEEEKEKEEHLAKWGETLDLIEHQKKVDDKHAEKMMSDEKRVRNVAGLEMLTFNDVWHFHEDTHRLVGIHVTSGEGECPRYWLKTRFRPGRDAEKKLEEQAGIDFMEDSLTKDAFGYMARDAFCIFFSEGQEPELNRAYNILREDYLRWFPGLLERAEKEGFERPEDQYDEPRGEPRGCVGDSIYLHKPDYKLFMTIERNDGHTDQDVPFPDNVELYEPHIEVLGGNYLHREECRDDLQEYLDRILGTPGLSLPHLAKKFSIEDVDEALRFYSNLEEALDNVKKKEVKEAQEKFSGRFVINIRNTTVERIIDTEKLSVRQAVNIILKSVKHP